MDLRCLVCLVFLTSLRPVEGQSVVCPPGQWQCDDSSCILDIWRCDGDGDCLDRSDEMDCNGSYDCPPGQFSCVDSVDCVDSSARCDGKKQCPTGFDEENCAFTSGCFESDWTCKNNICIPKELRCNGQNDCLDNSDEEDCDLCGDGDIRCPEGSCVPAEKRCDGQIDCLDGSDEPITCGRICSRNNGGCSHMCVDEPWGAQCDCPNGYELSSNGADCKDLDECSPPFAPCMQDCTNKDGSYYCTCKEGFILSENSMCEATGNATRIMTVQMTSIGLLTVKTQQFEVIQTAVFEPVALTFDLSRGLYYWADGHGSIHTSDGQQSLSIYTGERGINSLACDWLSGQLYWTNQETESIYMLSADWKSHITVLSKHIRPSELVLLPVESSMFWINVGPGGTETIEKSWMDGSDRRSLLVLTAQAAHGLTADVAARRLYWISDFKKSIETVTVDGTGRYSFTGLFGRGPALSLAVFESSFYWVDDKGLWQFPQNQPNKKKFLWKGILPLIHVYHELQQPQGPSACAAASCDLCLLTKSSPIGAICTCPNTKILLPDGKCEYPRFVYATSQTINLLEFRGRESSEVQLFSTDDSILSFDIAWYRHWLYWANKRGQVRRTSLIQVKTEDVPTPMPVCLIKVDQRSGNLYWLSRDQMIIGSMGPDGQFPQKLYETTLQIQDFYLNWLTDELLWLEGDQIFSMRKTGGAAKQLLRLREGVTGSIAFDLRANSLLWISKSAGLITMSLFQERSHMAGKRWNISGSVVVALEPLLLTLSEKVLTLWNRRDGIQVTAAPVKRNAFGVIPVLKEVSPVPTIQPCKKPSFLCPDTSVCLSQDQLCDGRLHCPTGDDERFCVTTCPSRGDFRCNDRSGCVPKKNVCDGHSHCHDGSDEVNCPTLAPRTTQAKVLRCRKGSMACRDGTSCVSYTHVCDGEVDCKDGSDEEECDATGDTGTSLTQTSTQTTKSTIKTTTTTPPPASTVHCPHGNSRMCRDQTQCVLYSYVCDGETDCRDGSDEDECDATGETRTLLTQTSTQTTKPTIKTTTTTPPPTSTVPPCYSPSMLCPQTSLCISPSHICNGIRDCPDGFDEKNCIRKCRSKNEFRCKDRLSCIPMKLVCDGHSHCFDGSDEVNCPSFTPRTTQKKVLTCRRNSRMCRDQTQCVLYSHVCDGETDCRDGSDEDECEAVYPTTTVLAGNSPLTESPPAEGSAPPKPSCISPSVLCPDSSACILQAQYCDGKDDCQDGSDENCITCPYKTDFRCKDGRSCISKNLVCDGHAHCFDGSDEVNCPTLAPRTTRSNIPKCRRNSRLCRDRTECVLYSHVCDGERDCRDGSDEDECDTTETTSTSSADVSVKPSCTSPSVLCPDSSVCILQTQFCDGKKDCSDGSDEKCLARCPNPNDFLCSDKLSCVSTSLVCDGRSHCNDGSDEVNCAVSSAALPVLKCRRGAKPCKDGSACVLYSHVCDGENDCLDGSDEQGCPQTCKPGEFQCAHGKKCIPAAQRCDGRVQCLDHSDEVNCWKQTKSCEFHCADGKRCIPRKFLCDGDKDCLDGTDEVGCDALHRRVTVPPTLQTTSRCISPSALCPGSLVCISRNQICNGQKDCPDGFDEENCMYECKNAADFLCSDRSKCIPKRYVCDNHNHCSDGSDEKKCASAPTAPSPTTEVSVSTRPTPVKCRIGFRSCKDGLECVLYSHVCDGEPDCKDGSDEEDCATKCKEGQFQCSHGKKCIPQQQVCDGHNDCQDRSDEINCTRLSEDCHLFCDNKTRCIPETFLCDGEKDCTDWSDEEECDLVPCAPHKYRCASGQCIDEALRCDSYGDCKDHSDERGCSRPPHCLTQLQCPHSHECLEKEWICDGEEDCNDGSDEKNCETSPVECREYQWDCGDSSQCIPLSWRCDGTIDCRNGKDEDKCSQRKCPTHLYQCSSGECVEPRLVCDGIRNCADRSDEGVGCVQRNCSSPSAPRCDHHCVSTPNGPKCYCAAGFKLRSSGLSCVDIDECTVAPHTTCKHICLNTRGSYVCHCHPGFYLEPDDKSCKTEDEPLLLASVQSEMLILGVRNATLTLVSARNRPVFSLDYDWAQQRVYWLSSNYESIRWTDLNNPNSKGTLIKGVKSDFIAVDWVGKNLYWVDGLVGQILAVKLSDVTLRSRNCTVVLGEDLEQPSSLVLLSHRGLMLWSEIGSTPQIERAGMDGSRRKVVVSRGLIWPVSLTFDLLDSRMYWVDEKLHCIGSASLDGDNVKILQLAETPSPFSVAVFSDRIFWSDTKRRTIRSADKNTGKDQKVLLKRPGQPFGLKLMHAFSQPSISSPCDQMRCSHLCLLTPAGRGRTGRPTAVCRCPKGLLLSKDRITCSLPTELSFILLLSQRKVYQIPLQSMHRDGVNLKKMPNSRVLSFPGLTEASALDTSIPGLSLYVADAGQGSVNVLKMSSSRSRQGLTPAGHILKLMDDVVTALAVDWVTSNLYWSSTRSPDLHVTARSNNYTALVLATSMKETSSIALHPPSSKLCYAAVGTAGTKSQSEVNCAWMDGRKKALMWKKSTVPTSLVFSNDGTIIYWADAAEGIINCIGLDGSGFRQYKTGPGLLTSLTYVENILIWVTLDKDVTKLWFSDGLQPKQLWFETKTSFIEVKAYSNNSQSVSAHSLTMSEDRNVDRPVKCELSGTNSCSNNNGGCVQLCLPYPGGRTCTCGRGFHTVNVTSCSPLPICPAQEISCSDGSKCISSSRFCDGHLDCEDKSDEQDCLNKIPTTSGTKTPPVQFSPSSKGVDATKAFAGLANKASESCDLNCNGHGTCITEGTASRCRCEVGYSGEFCQEAEKGQSHAGVGLGLFCLIVILLVAAIFYVKRRSMLLMLNKAKDKESLVRNIILPPDLLDSDSEEVESPIDVKNPQLGSESPGPKAD